MKVADACDEFMRDARSRNLSRSSLNSYGSTVARLRDFAEKKGVTDLSAIDTALLREWRQSWTCSISTHQLWLVIARTFFKFAVASGWIASSPAQPLKPPRDGAPPTMPLGRDEMRALLAAAGGSTRERALLLLMRYSGLAIRDACTLARAAVDGPSLTLRRAKTGVLVICDLPGPVAAELDAWGRGEAHFFWTGKSTPKCVAAYWRRRMAEIASRAGVEAFRPHRLRDTFAVELLLAGVSFEDIAMLLGHSSVLTTERYYAPWDRSRRDRLARIVRDAHRQDPVLRELYGECYN